MRAGEGCPSEGADRFAHPALPLNTIAVSRPDFAAKILLVHSRPQRLRARAFVVTNHNLYVRDFETADEVNHALDHETFQLIVSDSCEHPDDPFLVAERLARHPDAPPLVLLCPSLALDRIVKAIRCGVNDVFHPPVDFKALQTRAGELIRTQLGDRTTELTTARWSEIAQFLVDPGVAAAPAATPPRQGGAKSSAAPAADAARADRERHAGDSARLQEKLAEAERRLTELARREEALAADRAKLQTESEALADAEAQITQTRAELKHFLRDKEAFAQREQELAAAQQAQREAATKLAADSTRLEAERAALGQRRQDAAAAQTTAANAELEAERLALAQQQQRLAAERRELEQLKAKVEQRTGELAAKEKAHTAMAARFADEQARIEADRAAHDSAARAAAAARDEAEAGAERRATALKANEARLAQPAAEIGAAEAELAATRQPVESAQKAAAQRAQTLHAHSARPKAEAAGPAAAAEPGVLHHRDHVVRRHAQGRPERAVPARRLVARQRANAVVAPVRGDDPLEVEAHVPTFGSTSSPASTREAVRKSGTGSPRDGRGASPLRREPTISTIRSGVTSSW